MWKLCTRLVVISIVCVCALNEDPSNALQILKKSERRYCGRNLVNILKFLCTEGYQVSDEYKRNGGIIQKKSWQDTNDGHWVQPMSVEEPSELQFPFRPKTMARTFMVRLRRQTESGGIVDECCYKGCTLDELMDYCLYDGDDYE